MWGLKAMDFVYSCNRNINKFNFRMSNINLNFKIPETQQNYLHKKRSKLRIKNKFSKLFDNGRN